MRCLIVDDEALARREMRRLLKAHPWVTLIGEAATVSEAQDLIAQQKPDLLFVDIELRGESGFDLLRALGDLPPPEVILVTAYDQYALQAYEHSAFDYLLKPVHPERLSRALDRLRARVPVLPDRVTIKVGSSIRVIPLDSIRSIVAEGNYTRLFLEDEPSLLVLKPLKSWLNELPAPRFLQVHRTALVRLTAIRTIRLIGRDRREIELIDGTAIAIGPGYWVSLREALRSE